MPLSSPRVSDRNAVRSPSAGKTSLRDTVFRGLLADMPAQKPITLSAVRLVTNGPVIGAATLTELRTLIRPFPKDPGERDCYEYLLKQMHSTSDRARPTKAEFEKTCRRRFHVTVDSFVYCWREALKVTGARWDQPGRRPGSAAVCPALVRVIRQSRFRYSSDCRICATASGCSSSM